MLSVGDPAPDFPLPVSAAGAARLSGLLERGPVIVYFYPADFTRVCTSQACSIRDVHHRLAEAGLAVVAVSPQDESSHSRFAREHDLPFVLVADPGKTVIRAYRATWPLGIGVRRVTYLVGRDLQIVDRVAAEFGIARHRALIERAIGDGHR